jgi:diadenosine tetraphosphatase ApaH/serine/threonine PP2A family protein phosphatase
MLLVHDSPSRINEYLFEDREEKSLLRIMQDAHADILCCGHTHKPWHRILPEETSSVLRYRHAINIGSMGKPRDGDPRGCYVILNIGTNDRTSSPDGLGVEFVRFEYDVERAARAIEDSPLPDAFAEMLRKGV